MKVHVDSVYTKENFIEEMERGMQTPGLLELSEHKNTECCLVRRGTAESEKGGVVSNEQKGAECWEAC